MDLSTALEVNEKAAPPLPHAYGLRKNILSPLETLAQSISTIAPSTTPTMTIPLVFALAGTATWLAYGLALGALVLVALTIAAFARDSASPGSLYLYTRSTLPPVFAAVTAWALFFAYVTTASSVIGGFVAYTYVVLGDVAGWGRSVPAPALAVLAAGTAVWVAWRDIKISAQMMLWIEGVSVLLIALVVAIVLVQHGPHLDGAQRHLAGATPLGLRLGVMLALFSFVGFESATTLGEEARNPLQTIPRAVIRSAGLSGLFFIVCAYTEVLAFHGSAITLNDSPAPLHLLAEQAHLGFIGPIIDVGVLISMFAATLACVIAGARVLLLMARHGMVPAGLGRCDATHETPGAAGLLTGGLAVCPSAMLAARGASGNDIYGWMGTLAVFGFLTAYGLVAVALPVHLKRGGRLTVGGILLSVCATLAMVLATLGTLFPVPPAPYRYLPYVYLVFIAGGLVAYWLAPRGGVRTSSSG